MIMELVEYQIWEQNFVIQAYKQNDFVNLTQKLINEMWYSIQIDFFNKKILTNEKESIEYKNFINKLNIDFNKINEDLNLLFN